MSASTAIIAIEKLPVSRGMRATVAGRINVRLRNSKRLSDDAKMANDVTPTCRYGHGDLILARPPAAIPKLIPSNDQTMGFFVPVILESGQVNFAAGYVFELWKCAQCSYIEHHDREPMAGGES